MHIKFRNAKRFYKSRNVLYTLPDDRTVAGVADMSIGRVNTVLAVCAVALFLLPVATGFALPAGYSAVTVCTATASPLVISLWGFMRITISIMSPQ